MTTRAFITDLEGTLSNHDHRLDLRHQKKFDEFNEEFVNDSVNLHVYTVLISVSAYYPIIILTAKPEKYRGIVMEWISKLKIDPAKIYMRKDGDNRSDSEVKLDQLQEVLQSYEIVAAFDDRPSVLKMYRDNNIPCFDVCVNTF